MLSNQVNAQISSRISISELEKSLNSLEGADRVNVLHKLATAYRFKDSKIALEYSEESLEVSKEIKNDSLIAESYLNIGIMSVLEGDKILGIDMLTDAQALFDEEGYIKRKVITLGNLAAAYTEIGQYNEASDIYFWLLNYSKETESKSREVFTLTRIGVVFKYLGDYHKSSQYFREAIKGSIDINDFRSGVFAYTEAGAMEEEIGSPDSAIFYYQKAIDWLKANNSKHVIPTLLSNIGRLYGDKEMLDEAIKATKEAQEFADSTGNKISFIDATIGLAHIYEANGDFRRAIEILDEGLNEIKDVSSNDLKLRMITKLAENYYEIGKYDEAIIHAKNAANSALQEKGWLSAERSLKVLIKSEIEIGALSEAVKNQEKLMIVKDSLADKERVQNVLELDTRYRLSEKAQQIELLESENKRKTLFQFALVSSIVLVLTITFLIIRSQKIINQRNKAELESANLKKKKLEQELDYRSKQLTTQTLNLIQKNKFMEEIKEKVKNYKQEGSPRELSKLSNLVDQSLSLDQDWKQFRMHFEDVHTGFYRALKERYGDLTPNEMRLSALIKLNLNIKEIAVILGISPDSVKKARYRLRKKLKIDTQESLMDVMLQIEKELVLPVLNDQ